jgi:hypothetical protein
MTCARNLDTLTVGAISYIGTIDVFLTHLACFLGESIGIG